MQQTHTITIGTYHPLTNGIIVDVPNEFEAGYTYRRIEVWAEHFIPVLNQHSEPVRFSQRHYANCVFVPHDAASGYDHVAISLSPAGRQAWNAANSEYDMIGFGAGSFGPLTFAPGPNLWHVRSGMSRFIRLADDDPDSLGEIIIGTQNRRNMAETRPGNFGLPRFFCSPLGSGDPVNLLQIQSDIALVRLNVTYREELP